MTHRCSECGRPVGTMDTPYPCPRTGRMADAHVRIPRRTPRRPAPQQFPGPPLAELLAVGYGKALRRDRAAAASSATSLAAATRPTAGEEPRGADSSPAPHPRTA